MKFQLRKNSTQKTFIWFLCMVIPNLCYEKYDQAYIQI